MKFFIRTDRDWFPQTLQPVDIKKNLKKALPPQIWEIKKESDQSRSGSSVWQDDRWGQRKADTHTQTHTHTPSEIFQPVCLDVMKWDEPFRCARGSAARTHTHTHTHLQMTWTWDSSPALNTSLHALQMSGSTTSTWHTSYYVSFTSFQPLISAIQQPPLCLL